MELCIDMYDLAMCIESMYFGELIYVLSGTFGLCCIMMWVGALRIIWNTHVSCSAIIIIIIIV